MLQSAIFQPFPGKTQKTEDTNKHDLLRGHARCTDVVEYEHGYQDALYCMKKDHHPQ
jgi:hypothetical protein